VRPSPGHNSEKYEQNRTKLGKIIDQYCC